MNCLVKKKLSKKLILNVDILGNIIRLLFEEIYSEFEVYGDSYGSPPIEELVKKSVEEIKLLRLNRK